MYPRKLAWIIAVLLSHKAYFFNPNMRRIRVKNPRLGAWRRCLSPASEAEPFSASYTVPTAVEFESTEGAYLVDLASTNEFGASSGAIASTGNIGQPPLTAGIR